MIKTWGDTSNSYLRLVSTLQAEPKKRMIFCTPLESEQQSVLEAIQQFGAHMSSGKVLTVVMKRLDKPGGTIEVFVEDLKEMS